MFFAVLSITVSVHAQIAPQEQRKTHSATDAEYNLAASMPAPLSDQAATGQVSFHSNGGSGSMDPVSNLSDGEEFTLPRNTFTRKGFRFVGWTNMEGGNDPIYQDEYPSFVYYTYNSNLYAVWEPEESALELSFDANGGEGTMDPIYVRANQVILVPPNQFTAPEYGYECKGYGESPDDYARYRIGGTASFTQSLKLYAFWSPMDASIGGNSEEYKGQTVFFEGVNIASEDWYVTSQNPYRIYAEWKPGCGWYDAVQDWMNFCAFGAASNAIHWWLDRNKEYVDRYRQTHTLPAFEYEGKGVSGVFHFFMDKWIQNVGNFPSVAFNWFVNGIDDHVQESAKGQGGLFRDVFGDHVLVNFITSCNRRTFNMFIQEALRNKRMITIDEVNMAGGHAISCWGFEFDDEGYVCALYYSDSATSWNNTMTGRDLSLGKIAVKYHEESDWRPYIATETLINGEIVHGEVPIIRVYSYDQGTEYWESYFNSLPSSIKTTTMSPEDGPEEYYDLMGRKVPHPQKGLYITKSGKKILIR